MVSQRTRDYLKERSMGHCEICGLQGSNAHHRKNRSQGGKDQLSNLLWLCGSGTTGCHGHVTQNPAEAYSYGWSVPSFRDPHTTPVLLEGGDWYLLGDGGELMGIPTPAGGRVA